MDPHAPTTEEAASEYSAGGYLRVRIGERFARRYRIVRKLGWGHFSTVWLAHDAHCDSHVALKFAKSAPRYAQSAADEVALLRHVAQCEAGHAGRERLVAFLDAFAHANPRTRQLHHCIALEPLGMSLLQLLRQPEHSHGIPLATVKQIARQTLDGLDYLHRICRLVHTDLKPENVLLCIAPSRVEHHIRADIAASPPAEHVVSQPLCVDQLALRMSALDTNTPSSCASVATTSTACTSEPDDDISIKIADLGNAAHIGRPHTDDIQTRQYRAPEVILRKPWGPPVDLFSLGCLVFELLTADFLFEPRAREPIWSRDDDHICQMHEALGPFTHQAATGGLYSDAIFHPDCSLRNVPASKINVWPLDAVLRDKYDWSPDAVADIDPFLRSILALDPDDRPTAQHAAEHPWLS